jgi:hypothetical protein
VLSLLSRKNAVLPSIDFANIADKFSIGLDGVSRRVTVAEQLLRSWPQESVPSEP